MRDKHLDENQVIDDGTPTPIRSAIHQLLFLSVEVSYCQSINK